jgi:HEPN domain-containing protein
MILWATALHDYEAVLYLAENQKISPNIVGMHLQQTVEKAVKAYLTKRKVSYRFTHHIDKLLEYVERKIAVPQQFDDLKMLTPFGESLRYELPVPPDEFDAVAFIRLVTEFLQWIAEIGDFSL